MPNVSQSDSYTLPTGVTSARGGYEPVGAVPVWLGDWANDQSLGVTAGQTASLTGSVDIPSTFAPAVSYPLPPGVTLQTLSPTQVRINIGANTPVGGYTLAIEATAI